MPTLNLTNITIEERTTINNDTYFIIKDNDSNQNYFCFQNKLKQDWAELVNNWENIKEVEIEFEENENNFKTYRKVISLYTPQTEEIIV